MTLGWKICGLALANLALLAALVLGAGHWQLTYGAESLLLAPAADRTRGISETVAAALEPVPFEEWDGALLRLGQRLHLHVQITTPEGTWLVGERWPLPQELTRRVDRGHVFDGGSTASLFAPPPPVAVVRAGERYWVAYPMPLLSRTGPVPVQLVLAADSIFNPALFFDWRPLAGAAALGLFGSLLLWLPFLRKLTRDVVEMRSVSHRMAHGHFSARVAEDRGDELGALGQEINRMASQLGNYVGGQKRFLGDIAHELCSPLSRIHLQIALLEGQVDVAPSQLRRLGEIQQEVEELSTLVNELLHFSQAAIGAKLDLTPVVVEDAVRAAVAKEAPADALVDVEIEPGLRALANDVVFTRSLGNLVRNSLRYAGASGPICVTARRVDRDVVVTVADSGPGVHADVIERIFEPFYRPEESRSRSTGGAGLGLAIVKSGIEACNGTVTCRNRQPNGLEVSLRLPTA